MKVTLSEDKYSMPPRPLGFGKYFAPHMLLVRACTPGPAPRPRLQIEHDAVEGWQTPRIQPFAPLPLLPSALVFHYGLAVRHAPRQSLKSQFRFAVL